MGFGCENLWRGLMPRDNGKKTTKAKPISQSKRSLSTGRVVRKLFRGLKKKPSSSQNPSQEINNPTSSSHEVTSSKMIDAPICSAQSGDGPETTVERVSSTTGTSVEIVRLYGLDYETKRQEKRTTDADVGHDDVGKTADTETTDLMERPHQRQIIGAPTSTAHEATSSKMVVPSICPADTEDISEATVEKVSSTTGTNVEAVCSYGLEHGTEGQELRTNDSKVDHEDVKTMAKDRPHRRPMFEAQDSRLPQRLQKRLLRVRSAVDLGRKRAFSWSTTISSDDRRQSSQTTTAPHDSVEKSVYQIGESHAGLRSSEKAPETDIHWTPSNANTKLQEHQFSLPESGNGVLGELEPADSCVEDQDDEPEDSCVVDQDEQSDRASTKSSNNRTWNQLVKMLKQSKKRELMDLREDLEALIAEHQKEIDAANCKKVVLQKRVKKLLEQNANLEKKEKNLEFRNTDSTANVPGDRHLPSSSSETNLEQENLRLSNLVASQSSQIEEFKENSRDAHEQIQKLESDLAKSIESEDFLASHLQETYKDAETFRVRVKHLNWTLDQEPGKYADVDREIELRDQRYAVLDKRAGECFAALTALEKKSIDDQEAARAEIAGLETRLKKQDADIADLEMSKADFQLQFEGLYDMLRGRIVPSDLFGAMNEYFQLVIKDNDVLRSKIQEQMLETSSNKDTIKLLRFDNKKQQELLSLNRETQSKLEEGTKAQDLEIGRLRVEVEEQLGDMDDKDDEIANLEAEIDERSRQIDDLVRATDDRGLQHLIQSRDHEIADLKANLQNLEDDNYNLEQNQSARDRERRDEVLLIARSITESDELKIRLRAAEEEVGRLRREMQDSESSQS